VEVVMLKLYVWTDDRDGDLGDIFPEVLLSPEDWFGGPLLDQPEPGDPGWNKIEVSPN